MRANGRAGKRRTVAHNAESAREETRRYRELVRLKDPATMEKRRLAAICPVCGKRLIDGAHR